MSLMNGARLIYLSPGIKLKIYKHMNIMGFWKVHLAPKIHQ